MKTKLLDRRTAFISRNGTALFIAVCVLPGFPPNQRAQILNGFGTIKALRAYCAGFGIALYRCA